jgi:hypothetical protein
VEAAFATIEKVNPRLNAVLQTLPDLAHAEIRTGLPHGPFAGFRFSSRSSCSMPKTSAATKVAGLPEASSQRRHGVDGAFQARRSGPRRHHANPGVRLQSDH